MAASGFTLRLSLPKGIADIPRLNTAVDRKEFLQALDGVIWQLLAGSFPPGAANSGSGIIYSQPGGTAPAYASGTVTIAAGAGAIAAVVNGVSTSVTWATSDTATAAALAAAINASANALVKNYVTATSLAGVVTITATSPSLLGNAITLAATGTGASASGARLTGGAGDDVAVNTLQYF